MLLNEKMEVMTRLRDHFSKTGDADCDLLWTLIKGHALDDVLKAIDKHRLEKGSMAYRADISRIGSLTVSNRNDRQRGSAKAEKIGLWIQKANPNTFGMQTQEAIMLHFADAWEAVQSRCLDEYGQQMARAFIRSHCLMALQQIRVAPEECELIANGVVGLDAGQKIVGGKMFRHLEPLKTKNEAIQTARANASAA